MFLESSREEKNLLLKVKNPEKYSFNPRALLNQLVDIYLHLDSPQFVMAVANDEVGYRYRYRFA